LLENAPPDLRPLVEPRRLEESDDLGRQLTARLGEKYPHRLPDPLHRHAPDRRPTALLHDRPPLPGLKRILTVKLISLPRNRLWKTAPAVYRLADHGL
jgi:hypothetical protein